jgi:hypothetical protein
MDKGGACFGTTPVICTTLSVSENMLLFRLSKCFTTDEKNYVGFVIHCGAYVNSCINSVLGETV